MRVHTDCETWHGMSWFVKRLLFEVHVVEEEVAVLSAFKIYAGRMQESREGRVIYGMTGEVEQGR